MPKKILWMSRHPPHTCQKRELEKMFGRDVKIVMDDRPFFSGAEVKRRFLESGCDDIVLVSPRAILAELCNADFFPLWSCTEVARTRAGTHFKDHAGVPRHFNGILRVKYLKITFYPQGEREHP